MRAIVYYYLCLLLLSFSQFALCDDNKHRYNAGDGGGIRWHDLSVETINGVSQILHESTGNVPNGHVCGIIGPSGAGKSTFLAALAGTTLKSAALKVSGEVWREDENATRSTLSVRKGEVAFLQQHDAFFGMLTTRETLNLAAYLELPSLSSAERRVIVNHSLDALGLASVQHRRIGDGAARQGGGLSGGERRRLSVALELITTPKLFLADEPTTGLDSSQAEKVVRLIERLAKERNIPCLATLHQPRASIWKTLNSFILLAPGGRVCYMGDRQKATGYFAKLGYPCPSETNPAEYFIDLVSVDTEDPVQAAKDEDRIEALANAFVTYTESNKQRLYKRGGGTVAVSFTLDKKKAPSLQWLRRSAALLLRSWRQNIRNHRVNGLRLTASIGQAILFSQIFKTVRGSVPTAKSIADRTALLSYGVINMTMMALMKTIDLFSKEKVVVMREEMRKQYTSLEYLLSKVVAELPLDTFFATVFTAVLKATTGLRTPWTQLAGTFSLMTVAGASLGFAIGAITPNAESAMATGVPFLVILMVVGIINPSGIDKTHPPPQFVQWLKMISPIRWAIEALCVAEYEGMVFEHGDDEKGKLRLPWQKFRDLPTMGAFVMVRDGNQVLNALGLQGVAYQELMKSLAKLSGVHLLVCWMGLQFGGSKFVEADKNGASSSNANGTTKSERTKSSTIKTTKYLRVPLTPRL